MASFYLITASRAEALHEAALADEETTVFHNDTDKLLDKMVLSMIVARCI
jgi:hypothetical protein